MAKTYTGEFKNANMHGQGREEWEDGTYFVGNFKNGKRSGEGTMTEPGKKEYKGMWEKNKKHGHGIEINLKVMTFRLGEWRKGKWIRWLSSTQKIDELNKSSDYNELSGIHRKDSASNFKNDSSLVNLFK